MSSFDYGLKFIDLCKLDVVLLTCIISGIYMMKIEKIAKLVPQDMCLFKSSPNTCIFGPNTCKIGPTGNKIALLVPHD